MADNATREYNLQEVKAQLERCEQLWLQLQAPAIELVQQLRLVCDHFTTMAVQMGMDKVETPPPPVEASTVSPATVTTAPEEKTPSAPPPQDASRGAIPRATTGSGRSAPSSRTDEKK